MWTATKWGHGNVRLSKIKELYHGGSCVQSRNMSLEVSIYSTLEVCAKLEHVLIQVRPRILAVRTQGTKSLTVYTPESGPAMAS